MSCGCAGEDVVVSKIITQILSQALMGVYSHPMIGYDYADGVQNL
jgi:hypothetical protein